MIGGGVVGCAVAHALARRGVAVVLLEAEPGLALGASGANSGILHTGFDSPPGTLETRLILRGAELRAELADELGVEIWRCGARLRAHSEEDLAGVAALSENAAANGVEAHREPDGSLRVPGEGVTDPVRFVDALADAALGGGAVLRLNAVVEGIGEAREGGVAIELRGGERMIARGAVNCAGLFADEIARRAGEETISIYPRKGEFLVFAAPPGEELEEILLPVPSPLGKGVLVFPALDRHVIAGPTAREREDKRDWRVEEDASELILARALEAYPPLERARRVGAYAGLRPAGRGQNYVIAPSAAVAGLLHVAAIRSTGLSACLGIGEHAAAMLAEGGHVELGAERTLPARRDSRPPAPWWERGARHHAGGSARGPLA